MAKKSNPQHRYAAALQEAFGIEPNEVKGIFNTRVMYYATQLQRPALSIIDVEYNEDMYNWDKDYIREGLLLKGFLTFTEDDNGNLLPLKCGATGINVFNRVTTTIIANPVIGSFNRTIGTNCEIVYLQQKQGGRFRTLMPIITVFAEKLANADAAIDINLFNSRLPFIFQAPNNNVAESFKCMMDEIAEGQPAVFVDEEMGSLIQNANGSNLFMFKGKENFIADVVQVEKMNIMNEFLTAIGINSANTSKRERLITDEANANNMEIKANIKLWKENVEDGVKRVNKMFPDAGLKIAFPFYEEMERMEKESKEKSVDRPNEEGGEDNESSGNS